MPLITLTMSELEQQVIEDAIEYIAQMRNGLYRDVPRARARLVESVDRLQQEHDGTWQPSSE